MGIIRFLLALAVVIVHSSPIFGLELVPGYLAVQSFYIISGFLMAFVYNEKYIHQDKANYLFLSNRILKLYPLYLLVILLVALLGILYGFALKDWGKFRFYNEVYTQSPQSLGALSLVFLTNITLIGQDIISFFGIAKGSGNFYFIGLQSDMQLQELLFIPIAWTVAVELTFYFISPLLLAKKIKIIGLSILLVLGLRLLLFEFANTGEEFTIYRFAPTELFWYLLGVLAYKLEKSKKFLGANAGMVSLVILIGLLVSYKYLPSPLGDILIYSSVFLFAPAIFYRFSKSKIDRFLGDLCYPMYLGHGFLLLVISANKFPKPFGLGVSLVVLTIIFSILVNRYFLRPLENYRQQRVAVPGKNSQHLIDTENVKQEKRA